VAWILGLALLLPAILSAQPISEVERATLRLGVSASGAPLAFFDQGVLRGLIVDLARALAETLDRELQVQEMPEARLVDALRGGRLDLILSTLPETDLAALGLAASTPLFETGQMALIRTADIGRFGRPVDLIITDHHAPARDKPLPPAFAIINPKQPDCRYPFKELAGVGLAFKLAQGLLHAEQYNRKPVVLAEERLLDLVALGTVADLVLLLGENRSLVRRGLEQLNQGPRPGIWEAGLFRQPARVFRTDACTSELPAAKVAGFWIRDGRWVRGADPA